MSHFLASNYHSFPCSLTAISQLTDCVVFFSLLLKCFYSKLYLEHKDQGKFIDFFILKLHAICRITLFWEERYRAMINTVHTAPIPKRTVSGKWHFQVLLLYIWIAAIQMVCMHEFLETSCCWLESMTWTQVTNFVDLRLDLTCAKITWEFRIDLNIQFANYLHEKPSRFRTRCCLLSCPVPVHKTGTRLTPPTVSTLWSMSGFHIHMQVYVQYVLDGLQSDYCHLTFQTHTHTHTDCCVLTCWWCF